LKDVMAKLVVLVVAALVWLAPAARAQSTQACGSFDTNVIGTASRALLGQCNVTTGPNGIIFAVATAEATCTGTQTVQMFVGTGNSTVNGSNFLGSLSSGTLTVTSLVGGFGASPWLIQTGQFLSGQWGTTQTTITGQLSGTTGGVGTYSVADATITASSGTNMYTLNAPPGGLAAMTLAESQNICQDGFVLTSIGGSFTGAPNTAYNIVMTSKNDLSTTQNGWNNANIAVITY
jgi:hypothetical protein